jgi:hypothetical protein
MLRNTETGFVFFLIVSTYNLEGFFLNPDIHNHIPKAQLKVILCSDEMSSKGIHTFQFASSQISVGT